MLEATSNGRDVESVTMLVAFRSASDPMDRACALRWKTKQNPAVTLSKMAATMAMAVNSGKDWELIGPTERHSGVPLQQHFFVSLVTPHSPLQHLPSQYLPEGQHSKTHGDFSTHFALGFDQSLGVVLKNHVFLGLPMWKRNW